MLDRKIASILIALCLIGSGIYTLVVFADAPPLARQNKTVCSVNGIFCAHMNLDNNQIIVKRNDQPIWVLPGWFEDAYLADDGQHFVVGYKGLSLLRLDYQPNTTMITFWRRNQLIRQLALSDVIIAFSNLQRTVSHYRWGHIEGFDKKGRFVIHTVENRSIAYDVETGLELESWVKTFPGSNNHYPAKEASTW